MADNRFRSASNIPLLHFLLIGIAVFTLAGFAAKSSQQEEGRVVEVQSEQLDILMQRYAQSSTAVQQGAIAGLLEELILFEEGVRLGIKDGDIVVADRLLKNMKFVEATTVEQDAGEKQTPDELLRQALAMNMGNSDPVVRRRVIELARQQLSTPAQRMPITKTDIANFIHANSADYMAPGRYSISQVFIDPRRHSTDLDALLEDTKTRLVTMKSNVVGDVTLLERDYQDLSHADISKLFGSSFAEYFVDPKAPGIWWGPVQSAYGQHFVKINDYTPAKLPALERLYQRAYFAMRGQEEDDTLSRALAELRDSYYVQVAGSRPVKARDFSENWVSLIKGKGDV